MTQASFPLKQSPKEPSTPLSDAIYKASQLLLAHQSPEGYWWYTLEANESINAEFIFLMHYTHTLDFDLQTKIAKRLQKTQLLDGSWPIYYQGPGNLNATIECYFSLKLSGLDTNSSCLTKAREFILSQGGLTRCRVFTRIHLALFGLISWKACPAMPTSLIYLPSWFPFNIYEFSYWARVTIVPLLILMDRKKTRQLPIDFLDELYIEKSPRDIKWSYNTTTGFFSIENFLIKFDKLLRFLDKLSLIPFKKRGLKRCENWIREHLAHMEDIYPALGYGAMALYSLGYPPEDPVFKKCLDGLKRFRMTTDDLGLSPLPENNQSPKSQILYQQCCVSPIWDTPWATVSLLESGHCSPDAPELQKSARWLISKQILNVYGDWAVKNKKALPGGWAFEFENDYYPDVDDTIEVLTFLQKVNLPAEETKEAIDRGLSWLLSMQCKNGGWASFDVDNDQELINHIPFSDERACLDPPSPDITARMIEFLAHTGYKADFAPITKAVKYLEETQESFGGWYGRWGVNYIYGTWCVLQGLAANCRGAIHGAHGLDKSSPYRNNMIQKAVSWLKSIQNSDGGFGESCYSYVENRYIPLPASTASQTAWALMGLIAGGEGKSSQAQKAADFLIKTQNKDGSWDELYHTGTGFPGHFYIRYHGYRYYFPLLALSKYKKISQ